MKITLPIGLAVLLLLGAGCEKKSDAPAKSAAAPAKAAPAAVPAPAAAAPKAGATPEPAPKPGATVAAAPKAPPTAAPAAAPAPKPGATTVAAAPAAPPAAPPGEPSGCGGSEAGGCGGAHAGGEPAKGAAPVAAGEHAGCGDHGEPPKALPTPKAAAVPGKAAHFGAPFALKETVPLAAVLAKPDAFLDKDVRVSATINQVCKKKGCWFVLQAQEGSTETVRVTMKDYGFFVPTDCAGKKAVVEGRFIRKTVAEGMRKHLAADGGKDPAKVTGPAIEVRVVATGVAIDG